VLDPLLADRAVEAFEPTFKRRAGGEGGFDLVVRSAGDKVDAGVRDAERGHVAPGHPHARGREPPCRVHDRRGAGAVYNLTAVA